MRRSAAVGLTMMKILLHVCCANCAIVPFRRLGEKGKTVTGFFFNPNIHPFQEYRKRLDTVREYAERVALPVVFRDEYLLEEFLRNVASHPEDRCRYCYAVRLRATAQEAREGGYDGFTTTLLYSIYQKHDLIRETGEEAGREFGVSFLYDDFRPGWKEGVETSLAMGLYRQQYCGCIYSEKDRYLKGSRKKK
jgi:epoxyqueuosine reductase